MLLDQLQCRTAGDDARHVLGAGPPPPLLITTVDQRDEPSPAPDVEHANTLRSVELVGREREEVDTEPVDVEIE